jgi:undecaprenyl-diphosphatase
VLAGTAVGWHLVDRLLRPAAPGTQPSPTQVALVLVAGFLVLVGAAAGFAEIAGEIGPGGDVARFDDAFAAAIAADLAPQIRRLFAALTRLGDPSTLIALALAVAAVLVVRGRHRVAFAWLLALAGGSLLNGTLKRIFARVRPVHEAGLVDAPGWSFPSGHSSGAVVAYGLLAYLLVRALPARWHLPVVLAAAALAFTIGSSRVFVQVHFASDVVAGFLSGTGWLIVCLLGFELARHRRR